jgi:uncharacterized protein (DUF1810 family)
LCPETGNQSFNLDRFLEAQDTIYNEALSEISKGKKQSHWVWFIFQQIAGLVFSEYNMFYTLENIQETTRYLKLGSKYNRKIKFLKIPKNDLK